MIYNTFVIHFPTRIKTDIFADVKAGYANVCYIAGWLQYVDKFLKKFIFPFVQAMSILSPELFWLVYGWPFKA